MTPGRSTIHTPSGHDEATCNPTSIARRAFRTPPGPTSDTSRRGSRRSASPTSSPCRPTKSVVDRDDVVVICRNRPHGRKVAVSCANLNNATGASTAVADSDRDSTRRPQRPDRIDRAHRRSAPTPRPGHHAQRSPLEPPDAPERDVVTGREEKRHPCAPQCGPEASHPRANPSSPAHAAPTHKQQALHARNQMPRKHASPSVFTSTPPLDAHAS